MIYERIALAVPVLVMALTTLWVARRRSPLEPALIALVMTIIVATFFPIASALVKPLSWRHGVHLPHENVLSTQWQYVWFVVGLCAVIARVRLFRSRNGAARVGAAPAPDTQTGWTRYRDLVVAGGLVVGGGLLYSAYIYKVGLGPLLDRDNFAEKYRVSSGLGPLYAGLNLMIVGCLWAEASQLARGTRRLFAMLAAAIFIWSVAFVAVRTYAAALGLGYLYMFCRRREFTISRVRPSWVVMLLAGYVGVEVHSLLRSVWTGSITEAMSTLSEEAPRIEQTLGQVVGGSEFSHPFLTMMELQRYEEGGAMLGRTYLDGLAAIMPLALMPDRGPTIAQDFANRHYPELAERGGGTAFSLVGEAWWNFGDILGPLLCGLALGWLLMGIETQNRLRPSGVLLRFTPYLLHLILLVHRNSFSSIAKQLFTVGLPICLLLAAAQLTWSGLGRRSGAPRPTPFPRRPLGPKEAL